MKNKFTIQERTELVEMLPSFTLLNQLYSDLTPERYETLLKETIPHNYKQITVHDNEKIVGVCGYWIATKIWCGKYLELDNVVVHESYRSKGIGKIMTDYLLQKAKKEGCNMLGLDVYTDNFKGVKFYMNQGYVPRGFHMINVLNGSYGGYDGND